MKTSFLFLALLSCAFSIQQTLSSQSLEAKLEIGEHDKRRLPVTTTVSLLPTSSLQSPQTEINSTRFMPLVRQIIKFCDGMENMASNLASAVNGNKINALRHNADAFRERIDKLLSGEASGDYFLQFLLEHRLTSLLQDMQYAITYQQIGALPTDPTCWKYRKYETEALYKCVSPDFRKEDENIRRMKIDEYQFVNQLIKTNFHILFPHEISEKTRRLLRASPKLWALLQNQTSDLGQPDEAGGWAKVAAYLADELANPSFKKETALSNAVMKMTQVTSPTWEVKKYSTDFAIYAAHFFKGVFIPFKGLGANVSGTKKNQGVFLEDETYYEAGEWPEDLPDPEFLRVNEHKTGVDLPVSLGLSFFDVFPFEKLTHDEDMVPQKTIAQVGKDNSEQNNSGRLSTTIVRDENTQPNAPQDAGLKAKGISSTLEVKTSKLQTIPITKVQKEYDYLPPSGIRKFHQLMPKNAYAPRTLTSKNQEIVDTIFDSRTFVNVTYGQFKKLWQDINGIVIEDGGGSHRELRGPRGDSIGGIFAHNDAQTYKSKTIKYLQAALWYVGCRPSQK